MRSPLRYTLRSFFSPSLGKSVKLSRFKTEVYLYHVFNSGLKSQCVVMKASIKAASLLQIYCNAVTAGLVGLLVHSTCVCSFHGGWGAGASFVVV